MPHPEGYRKALRLMKLAEKFQVPVLTFIDTPGAWAGLGAEERGQSEAIARNLFEMSQLAGADHRDGHRRGRLGRRARARRRRPRADAGERGLLGDHRRRLRGDPLEGRQEPGDARAAATALRITAPDLFELRVIDEIIPEPPAARTPNHEATAAIAAGHARASISRSCERFKPDKLVRRRREKFLRMGQFAE